MVIFMDIKYEKAFHMLKTEHKCPSMIAEECEIDSSLLHDMTDDCYYDDAVISCELCRTEAAEYMLKTMRINH